MSHGVLTRARNDRILRWTSHVLLAVGVVLLGVWAVVKVSAYAFQVVSERRLEQQIAARHSGPAGTVPPAIEGPRPLPRTPEQGEVLGRIEVPALGLSAIVREGVDDGSLRIAVGHVPGTALPGQPANIGLAGHRDTYFRPLAKIGLGDELVLTTPDETYRYRVQWTKIVEPEDTWVLGDTKGAALTLVTCYPFEYIGHAPHRFIVRAVPF